MMAALTATAALVIGGTMAAYGAYESRQASKQYATAQRQQYEAERKKAEVENVRNIRMQIRQARIAQATMENSAATSNVLGSSGLAGGVASVGSQLASNLSYMSDVAEQNSAISAAALSGANAQRRAANGAAFTQLGSTIFSQGGGGWRTVFGGNQ